MGFQRFDEGTKSLIWSWSKFVRLAHQSHKGTDSLLFMSSFPRSEDLVRNIKPQGVKRKIRQIFWDSRSNLLIKSIYSGNF
jgi:hypothetical protein